MCCTSSTHCIIQKGGNIVMVVQHEVSSWCRVLHHLEKTSTMTQNKYDVAILLIPLASFKGGNYRHLLLSLEVYFWCPIPQNLKKPQTWPKICSMLLYLLFYTLHLPQGETIAMFVLLEVSSWCQILPKPKEKQNMTQHMYEFNILRIPLASIRRGNTRHLFLYVRCMSDVKFYQLQRNLKHGPKHVRICYTSYTPCIFQRGELSFVVTWGSFLMSNSVESKGNLKHDPTYVRCCYTYSTNAIVSRDGLSFILLPEVSL